MVRPFPALMNANAQRGKGRQQAKKCLVGLADYVCKFHRRYLVDKLSSGRGTENSGDLFGPSERKVLRQTERSWNSRVIRGAGWSSVSVADIQSLRARFFFFFFIGWCLMSSDVG